MDTDAVIKNKSTFSTGFCNQSQSHDMSYMTVRYAILLQISSPSSLSFSSFFTPSFYLIRVLLFFFFFCFHITNYITHAHTHDKMEDDQQILSVNFV